MNRINQISPENIEQLNARQLVELLRILLYSEARQQGVAKSGVHVPLQINVADGGEDGRWKTKGKISDFIPNDFTVYQCKAERIGETACMDEILANRGNAKKDPVVLKQQVKEVFEASGCYCFFCSYAFVQKDIDARIEKAREALKEAGRTTWDTDQITFLDGNKIAEWVNRHAAAIAYVSDACRITQPVTFTNWKTLARYPQNTALPFEANAYLQERLATLQASLVQPNAVARIVGQSGLGKSRLAFEVFRPVEFLDGSAPNRILTDSMVYFDLEDSTNEKFETIRQLAHQGVSGIIVVDNCDRATHDKLTDLIKMNDSGLSLLTVDYEPEPLSSSFTHVDLNPEALRDIIPRLLERIPAAMKLSAGHRNYISSFCQGFPQIAFLLAQSQAPLTIDALDERNFAKKLLWGRDAEDPKDLAVIKSLALFRHVGADRKSGTQLQFVSRALCNSMPEREFRDRSRRFQKLRVIQKAGDFWMVTPRPLAIALAADWWESATTQEIMQILPQLETQELLGPFCDQLRLLNFSQNAQEISGELCGPNGFFYNAEALFSSAGSRLFRSVVELNPSAALTALKHAFASKSSADLRSLTIPRRNLVWALEKLCWDPVLFPTASRLLLKLASGENETCANNATGQFKQLFQLYLSGTETPALDRLAVVEEALSRGKTDEIRVCIDTLGVALVSTQGRFIRSGGSEVRGSLPPRSDWKPTSPHEIAEYQYKAFTMLAEIAVQGSDSAELAKTQIGNHLVPLVTGLNSNRILERIDSMISHFKGYWPEARNAIERLLEYHVVEPLVAEKAQQWLVQLVPDDLQLKLKQTVTNADYRHHRNADGTFTDLAAKEAEKLGRELGEQPAVWLPFLTDLQTGKQNKAYEFGTGVGATHVNPADLLQTCLNNLKQIPVQDRNCSLLGGILRVVSNVQVTTSVLEQVANDDSLIDVLVRLTVLKPVTRQDLERVTTAMRAGKIPVGQLQQFCFGSVTDTLSANDLIDVLVPLASHNISAIIPVYQVFAMYTFNESTRWASCKGVIKNLMSQPNFVSQIGDIFEHQWADHCALLLREPGNELFAENQCRQILETVIAGPFRLRYGPEQQKVVSLILQYYGSVCWPIIGDGILSERYFEVQNLVRADTNYASLNANRLHDEVYTCPIWDIDKELLVSWCKQHSEGVERLLEVIGLFTTESDGTFRWHPVALAVLEECHTDDNEAAVATNLTSFGSSGSRVPYLQRRIALVKLLETNPRAHLRTMARNLVPHLQQELAAEKKSDEEFNAGIY